MASLLQEQIFQELQKLYFVKSYEIDEIIKKIEGLPDETLSQFLSVIKETKEKQDSLVEKFGQANPAFITELDTSLKGTVDILKAQHRIIKNIN